MVQTPETRQDPPMTCLSVLCISLRFHHNHSWCTLGFQKVFFSYRYWWLAAKPRQQGVKRRQKKKTYQTLSNRKHCLFHIRYFENGPLEPGYSWWSVCFQTFSIDFSFLPNGVTGAMDVKYKLTFTSASSSQWQISWWEGFSVAFSNRERNRVYKVVRLFQAFR